MTIHTYKITFQTYDIYTNARGTPRIECHVAITRPFHGRTPNEAAGALVTSCRQEWPREYAFAVLKIDGEDTLAPHDCNCDQCVTIKSQVQ